MAEYEYVGDGRPDGTVIGRTATEKIGFFGATPVVKQTGPATATDAAGALAAVNVIRTALINLGLVTTV